MTFTLMCRARVVAGAAYNRTNQPGRPSTRRITIRALKQWPNESQELSYKTLKVDESPLDLDSEGADWPAVRNASAHMAMSVYLKSRAGTAKRSLRCCRSLRAPYLPDYFGRNWDAFDECIQDLEWVAASGYLVVIANADRLLEKDKDNYDVFLDSMRTAAKEWHAPNRRESRNTISRDPACS